MRVKKLLKGAVITLFWLAVWQVVVGLLNRTLLIPVPTPLTTGAALLAAGKDATFWLTAGASLLRICAGFALAVVAGSGCALLSARWSLFRSLTAPLLKVIRAVPVASFILLVFLWLPKGQIPSFIAFLTVFPVVWANVETGLFAADRNLTEMARVMGLSRRQILTEITFPCVRPYFTAAVATGLGFAWKAGVAAEVICRSELSLGNLLWAGKNAVDYDTVFALTVVIVVLSVLLESGVKVVLKGGERRDPV